MTSRKLNVGLRANVNVKANVNSSVEFLVKIGYILHTFLILTNSSFYMNEPLKGTNCLQKSLDGIFMLPDKV